jgi:hypothetical protein
VTEKRVHGHAHQRNNGIVMMIMNAIEDGWCLGDILKKIKK